MKTISFRRHYRSLLLAFAVLLSTGPILLSEAPSAKLALTLQPFIDQGHLAGAVVLVADADKVLATEAVGMMDIAAKTPMRTDCMFWIASMTKPITCTALMMLADEGKVDVDAPVAKYLPEFKEQMLIVERDDEHVLLKKPVRPMRVRDLMSQPSGITGYDIVQSVMIQSDGRIVVAGRADVGSDIDFGLARYNLDGTLDLNFGTNGKVTTSFRETLI